MRLIVLRGAITGRSLQEYLRAQLIELAARPEAEVVVARMRDRKRQTKTRPSSAKILAHRDAGRR